LVLIFANLIYYGSYRKDVCTFFIF